MAATGKQFKGNPSDNKNSIAEVLPESLVKMLTTLKSGVKEIIYDYSFDAGDEYVVVDSKNKNEKKSVWLQQPATGYTFFGISSLEKQILALAEYAGPLDQIEWYIRKAHTRNETRIQATLMQAIKFAVIGLDQTIRDEEGTVLDEGMAERLLKLHAELFPNYQLKALKQAQSAAPLETDEAKKVREEVNLAAMNEVFDAFIKNDKDALPAAIETFKQFVKKSKPKVITDNLYYLNLLHLLFAAFDVLARRGGQETSGQWYGKLADRFCFEIIGAAIESDMPHRVKQILRSGVYYLLSGDKKAVRQLDISGALFRGDGTDYLLGVNSYFDDAGDARALVDLLCGLEFSKLITSNYISIQNLLYNDRKLSESVPDNVEIRRSPAATAAAL